jgi:hypothetical protein
MFQASTEARGWRRPEAIPAGVGRLIPAHAGVRTYLELNEEIGDQRCGRHGRRRAVAGLLHGDEVVDGRETGAAEEDGDLSLSIQLSLLQVREVSCLSRTQETYMAAHHFKRSAYSAEAAQ